VFGVYIIIVIYVLLLGLLTMATTKTASALALLLLKTSINTATGLPSHHFLTISFALCALFILPFVHFPPLCVILPHSLAPFCPYQASKPALLGLITAFLWRLEQYASQELVNDSTPDTVQSS
jgi:hypothetical protein